eukprot:765353-Hanusia_phi.AAC.4
MTWSVRSDLGREFHQEAAVSPLTCSSVTALSVRQLLTKNLSVHDIVDEKSTYCSWDRGSIVTTMSHSCPGPNRPLFGVVEYLGTQANPQP